MMVRSVYTAALALVVLAFLISPAFGISSGDLLGKAAQLDGERVTFQGEAVGDVMRRGSHGWVNLYDGSNAIGVWAPASALEQITHVGGYDRTGDVVRVVGTFRQSCSEHGGDIDIHAERLIIVRAGEPVTHPLSDRKLFAAGLLAPLALVIFFVERYQKRHFIATS